MSFACRFSLLVWAFIFFIAHYVGAFTGPAGSVHRELYPYFNMLERLSSQLDLLRYEIENLNLKMEISDRKTDALKNSISEYLSEGSRSQCGRNEIFAENNETKSTFDKMRQDQLQIIVEMNLLKDNFQKILKNVTPLESEGVTLKTQEAELNVLPYDEHLNCIKDCDRNSVSGCENVDSDGIYVIDRSTNEIPPFYAYCVHEKNENDNKDAWMIIQRRDSGSVNFNRNWEDYKHGFGNITDDYWIGLERVKKIISGDDKTYDLWTWTSGDNYNSDPFVLKFMNISLASEQNGYAINWSESTGNERYLKAIRNKKFSTFDMDNDDVYMNCARNSKAGWWYSECRICNLNSESFEFCPSCIYTHMAIRART